MAQRFSDVFSIDLRALSLFRVSFGILLLAHLFIFTLPVFNIFYTDAPESLFTRDMSLHAWPFIDRLSIFRLSGTPWILKSFLAIYFLGLLAFILGYKTHIAKWVVFIVYSSLYFRADILNSGAEGLMRLLLLWCLFVPLNRYWSIDAALCRGPRDQPVSPILMSGLKFQIVAVYLFAGLFKLLSQPWLTENQVALVMHDRVHGSPLGALVSDNFWDLLMPANYGIMIFQIIFVFLVFSPVFVNTTRAIAIAGAIITHISFILLMRVGFFPYVCLLHLIILIPANWWDALLSRRLTRHEKIEIYYEPGCLFCEKISLIFRELCLSPSSKVLPADADPSFLNILQKHNSWIVHDRETSTTYLKWNAVAFVWRQMPLTWILGVLTDITFMRGVMRRFYDFTGRHRSFLASVTRRALPFRESYKPAPAFIKFICLSLIAVLLMGNTATIIHYNKEPMTLFWRNMYGITQVKQRWNLFVPATPHHVYNYHIVGLTVSGKEIDLTDFLKPGMTMNKDLFFTFTPTSWLKYFLRTIVDENKISQMRLADVICHVYYPEKYGISDPVSKITIHHSRQGHHAYKTGGAVEFKYSNAYPCQGDI